LRWGSTQSEEWSPNGQALGEFGQKPFSRERDDYLIGDDLDSILTSPWDHQK
jgi:hypothetical protein